jgi:hypothetical protein
MIPPIVVLLAGIGLFAILYLAGIGLNNLVIFARAKFADWHQSTYEVKYLRERASQLEEANDHLRAALKRAEAITDGSYRGEEHDAPVPVTDESSAVSQDQRHRDEMLRSAPLIDHDDRHSGLS